MTENKKILDYNWLAGLIDGDGCFYLNKAKYGCLEITVATMDRPMLEIICQEFGGFVRPRAGSASVRWRVHNKSNLLLVLHAVNGRLQNFVRQKQFEKLALVYGLRIKPTQHFEWQNAYLSGLFDSDGKIVLSVKSLNKSLSLPEAKGKGSATKSYNKELRLAHSQNSGLTIGTR